MCLKETEKARFVQTAENVQFPEKISSYSLAAKQIFYCSNKLVTEV